MKELVCPKCNGSMRTYERNGVHVDQCGDCRGIFLDRGELERLMDAEAQWKPQAAAPQVAPQQMPQTPGYQPKPYYKKKKSFLEELFD
jgi:Zn-finger nucleic acid-binding protein